MRDRINVTGAPAAVAGYSLLLLLAHAPVVLLGHTFMGRDYRSLVVPLRTFLAEGLRAGRLPQWCDALGFGVPFLANPQNHVFYPPTWLVALLPVPLACDLLVLLHLLWAGLGLRGLALRLGAGPGGAFFAGAAFMLGGYASSMVPMGTPLDTLAWLPWIAQAADRVAQAEEWRERARATVWVAVTFAAAFLAGDPAGVVTGGWLAIGVLLIRAPDNTRRLRGLRSLAEGTVVAALLAGLLLVPAIIELRESQRGGGLPNELANVWSMHPWRFVELFVPRAFGDQTRRPSTLARIFADSGNGRDLDTTWSSSIYLGLPFVLLVAASLRREDRTRGLALLGLGFLVLALGKYTPIYGLYRQLFLAEAIIRYPERHLAGAMVLWTALAGVGLRRVFSEGPSRRLTFTAIAGAAVLGLVVILEHALAGRALVYFEALAKARDTVVSVQHAIDVAQLGGLSAFLIAAVSAVALGARRWVASASSWSPIVLSATVLSGFGVEARAVLPVLERSLVTAPPAILRPLIGQPHDYPGDKGLRPRLYRDRFLPADPRMTLEQFTRVAHDCANENVALPFGFAHVPGYQPGQTASARIARFLNRLPIVLDAFDVRYMVLLESRLPKGPKRAINIMHPMALMEAPRSRPRGFVAARWSWWRDDDTAIEGLSPDAIHDMGATRLIGQGADSGSDRRDVPASRCGVEQASPEDVSMKCDSRAGGHAVLLDEWAPGWSAEVDGQPAPLLRSDALFRAVPIQPGTHAVRMRYSTPGLGAGAVASGLGLVLLGVLAWLPGLGRQAAPGPATGSAPRRRRPKG